MANSATVTAGTDILATAYNNLRKDAIEGLLTYFAAGGSANAYTGTVEAQYTAYVTGSAFRMLSNHVNTGAATLNLSSLGVQNITLINGGTLRAGDIPNGGEMHLMYNGTSFLLLNPALGNIQGDVFVVTAGETIAVGETVCYSIADAEWMLGDANSSTKVRVKGIAISTGVNAGPMTIQTSGIVTGLSGLTAGTFYYQSDTAGALSSTPSTTTSIPIGLALSTTSLLLTFGKKMAYGAGTSQATVGTQDETITIGFRAEHLILMGQTVGSGAGADGHRGALNYINGNAAYGFIYEGSASVDSGAIEASIADSGGTGNSTLTCNSVTDTTFVIRTVNTGSAAGSTQIRWVAIGE